MAKIIAPSARTTLYNGVHGNQSVAVLGASLAAAAAGDVVVLGEFDGHPTITDFRLDHANLGAGTSVDIGFAYLMICSFIVVGFSYALYLLNKGIGIRS